MISYSRSRFTVAVLDDMDSLVPLGLTAPDVYTAGARSTALALLQSAVQQRLKTPACPATLGLLGAGVEGIHGSLHTPLEDSLDAEGGVI